MYIIYIYTHTHTHTHMYIDMPGKKTITDKKVKKKKEEQ